jgi:predicted anti-sigma-YlaC factor YlaD
MRRSSDGIGPRPEGFGGFCRHQSGLLLLVLVGSLAFSGCSVRKMAINKLGDALSQGGGAMASDEDPELVKAAIPFSLKLVESLLAEAPEHRGLLLAAASGFAQYSYAFVHQEAEELEAQDAKTADHLRTRARRLYLRAHRYGLRALETTHPGFEKALRANTREAVRQVGAKEVPQLYWTALSWLAAISISKEQPEVVADQPLAEALLDRALELNESYEQGALHSFLITYEQSRRTAPNEADARSRQHFERAVALSKGQAASPYVALAEAVSLKKQDRQEFEALLKKALAINPDAAPGSRLINLITQRRARWLLERADDLILPPLPAEDKK